MDASLNIFKGWYLECKIKKEKLTLKAQNLLFLFLSGESQEEFYLFKVRKMEKSILKASWWSFCIPTSQSQLNGYLSFKKCTGKKPCQQFQTEASRQNVIQP